MIKATHLGTCQCCGSRQKLPGGVLAQHGYKVVWGQFDGVCLGSQYLPYEQSCGVMQDFAALAKERRVKMVAFQAELLKPATQPRAWVDEFVSARKPRRWIEVNLISENGYVYYIDTGGKKKRVLFNWRYIDLLDWATRLNAEYAKAIQQNINEIDKYIAWLDKRIAEWEPAELHPIKQAV